MSSAVLHTSVPSQAQLNNLPRLIPRKKKASPPHNPLPIPETPSLPTPPDTSALTFFEPVRRIIYPSDNDLFLSSSTYKLILSFVFSLSDSVASKRISAIDLTSAHPSVLRILSILDSIEDSITRFPPDDQGGSRFGNPAFRRYVDNISTQAPKWHADLGIPPSSIAEVSTYLVHSLGNRARIDYGSGHELNFIIWLLCLNRLSFLPESTFPALAPVVFSRYIKLLRRLQSTYYLEPAGSHGVWGLDDYHFLPFLFGASQLSHHPYIRPLSIHNDIVLEEEGDDYLYLDMVRFTMASKTVKGLKWTQPMLDDISGAKSWEKVEQGMRKMFVKEVLGKLPVMQHFLFGSLVPAAEGMSVENGPLAPEGELLEGGGIHVGEDGAGHVHRDDAWGDCCGIKIPSTVAANQEALKQSSGEGPSHRKPTQAASQLYSNMTPPSRSPTPPSTKRLLQELRTSISEPSPILQSLGPISEAQLLHWDAVMKGVPGTAYEGIWRLPQALSSPFSWRRRNIYVHHGLMGAAGLWKLDITVPPSYPIQPPTIKFLTPICHPNVHFQAGPSTFILSGNSSDANMYRPSNQTGEICIDLLKDSWSPTYTLTTTLEAIHHLLSYPEVDSPLNVDIAMLLKNNDRIGGESLVRFWCEEKRWSG